VRAAQRLAAENAADLSVQQLADLERYIEDQLDTAVGLPPVVGPRSSAGRRRLWSFLAWAVRPFKRLGISALQTLDLLLAPYCLSGKRLLGIAGVLIWAMVIAYVLRTWILSGHRGGE
jgi:hypothetical protein